MRGQLILVAVVATVLSLAFWAIGEPYWILIGAFAGLVEIVPVIGPITAGALAIGVGATASTTVAILAGVVVLVVRLLEDYLVIPRVLGDAVGLTPLVVLVLLCDLASTSSREGSRRSTHSSIDRLRRRGRSARASSCSAWSPSKRIVLVTKRRSTGICSVRASL